VDALVLLIWIAPIAVVVAIARNRGHQRRARSATVELVVDELGVRRSLADGREEAVDWVEVREVTLVHTRKGPHGAAGGMVVLYGDATRGCVVPLDRAEPSGLLEALSRLPRFDVRQLSDALRATSGTQELWVHPEGGYEAPEAPLDGSPDDGS
jgi:hypothetical protein